MKFANDQVVNDVFFALINDFLLSCLVNGAAGKEVLREKTLSKNVSFCSVVIFTVAPSQVAS